LWGENSLLVLMLETVWGNRPGVPQTRGVKNAA